jgi:hypothetical protein
MDEQGRTWVEMVEAEDARTERARRTTRLMRRLVPVVVVLGLYLIGPWALMLLAGLLFIELRDRYLQARASRRDLLRRPPAAAPLPKARDA